MKKLIALTLALLMVVGCLSACGGSTGSTQPAADSTQAAANDPAAKTGKILFLSSLSSGLGYDYQVKYFGMLCDKLGYKLEIAYGDPTNDPAGNLSQIKNAMTSDVVGIMLSQDGGVADIMAEYPNLPVVGINTDMSSVYSEGGASASVLGNPNFLGSMADGYVHGEDYGSEFARVVIEKGYKKVAVCTFPPFAYPQQAVADAAFRAKIAEYNETAAEADKITIVGDAPTILMFSPLDSTFFNEPQHQDLDALVGILAGQTFLYSAMIDAISNGLANPNMKLVCGGLEGGQEFLDEFGTPDGIVQTLLTSAPERLFFPMVLLDNAIQGKQFPDLDSSKCVDAPFCALENREIFEAFVNNSSQISLDMTKLALPWEDAQQYFTRYNPDATYADLLELMSSERLTAKAFMK